MHELNVQLGLHVSVVQLGQLDLYVLVVLLGLHLLVIQIDLHVLVALLGLHLLVVQLDLHVLVVQLGPRLYSWGN